ncbi:MAG TPA: hypothetical protein VGI44_12065, partial [Acidimicrobiales bacterium]
PAFREAAVLRPSRAPLCRRNRGVERQRLSNFPQAFTRLALIDALGRVINLESDGRHTDRPGAEAPGRYLWFAGTWSRRLEHPGATLIRLT